MIRLEYFDRNDFQQLIDWIQDEYLLANWSGAMFRFPLTEDSLEWYINDTNNKEASDAFVYKAVDAESGQTVGHISLGGISRKNKSARISRVLVGNTAERGKGYCTAMITAVLKVAFDDLKLHKVSLGVYDFNKAAIRCYQKAGLSIEGTLRDVLKFGNEYWSIIEMGMLEHEWRALQHVSVVPEDE